MFFCHFTKVDNFCEFQFASQDGVAPPNWALLLRKEFVSKERICSKRKNWLIRKKFALNERICSTRSKFFSL